jgi:LacI family transcriptional regulator
MITGSTNTLGVVIADIENPFFARVLRGVSDAAHAAGFEVILSNTDESAEAERTAIRVLLEKQVDGLLVCPADGEDSSHLSDAVGAGTPVVLLDRRVRGLRVDTVGIDNRAAAREATEHLISRGHRSIGLLTGVDVDAAGPFGADSLVGIERATINTTGERAAGYRDALLAAKLPVRSDLVSTDGFRRQDSASATARMLAGRRPPTALLALDSVLALGALQAIRDLGLSCPEDVSLIGFDEADWTDVMTPPLSVIAQPENEIGSVACGLLLDRIAGRERAPVHRKLPVRYVERSSVAAAPRRVR